ncbi:MAG: right-handed parallel beta-helix repeat-containing protein [Verrucomicrobia bacterium]|nr:right-handed parallel beta-helix repeat-containing protein [Verrucomicrobiota bacterium]
MKTIFRCGTAQTQGFMGHALGVGFLLVLGFSALPGAEAGPGLAPGGAIYYVDGVAGWNTNTGSSPDSAWRDFSNINGQTLNADDQLLIKRGSVINQELRVGAKGATNRWVEIGAYGEGARPVIRRNWDIAERCALVTDPDCLRIRGLAFSHAGKGLVVHYATPGHGGLVIEDCVAHHIEGIYREWTICSGIPEWRGYAAPTDDGFRASAGIAVSGRGRDITIRDCDLFLTSWGFWVAGERVTLDRIYVHHCYTFNSSPHPALLGPKDSVMQNCVFDASGYHAFAGTMGIMLGSPRNLTIRNCTFRNQPDSGCHDEGGIDFENGGDGCLIDRCTFENNAGAAIEVLGLESPQPKNVEIRGSRFIKNNWAKKLGPSEIFIWGRGRPDPRVCCSTGIIRSNGCVLAPGVQFFTNQAPTTTQWTLEDNRTFASVAELEQAMPCNKPPVVEAGQGITTDQLTVQLAGVVTDDAKPAGKRLMARWEALEGPGVVKFLEAGQASGRAEFSAPGDYLLRLVGDDGELWTSDLVNVHILPRGVTLAKAWEFNTALDKEGWTEADLGTTNRVETPLKNQHGTSLPVKYVAGGYYIVAVENAPAAKLTSADNLNVALQKNQVLRLRLQNHTGAARMVVRFTTTTDGAWDDAKSRALAVTPNDPAARDYVVEMGQVPGWRGTLKQLRLDLTTDEAATGTVRVDSIRIENAL